MDRILGHTGPAAARGAAMPAQEPALFAAVLHPNRSLSRRGAVLVLGVAGLVSAVMGGLFLMAGAWPVFGFYGLELAVLWLMLRQNYRDGMIYETVHLTPACLTVERGDRHGPRGTWASPPHWLKVIIDDPVRHESQLCLASHGRSVVVGSFLAPEERLDLARALSAALQSLREPPGLPAG